VGTADPLQADLNQRLGIIDYHVRVRDYTPVSHVLVHIVFPSLVFGPSIDLNLFSLAEGGHVLFSFFINWPVSEKDPVRV
jgi:hypothetical protein